MKQGDKFDVKIEGQTVAQAEVREVGDGQVTLVVPGTIVVMGTATSLAPEQVAPAAPVAPSNAEHQILGVDHSSASATSGPVDTPVVAQDTPAVPTPTPTAPSSNEPVTAPSAPAQDAAEQSVQQVVAAEEIAPTVGDNGAQPAANDSGNPDVPQQ